MRAANKPLQSQSLASLSRLQPRAVLSPGERTLPRPQARPAQRGWLRWDLGPVLPTRTPRPTVLFSALNTTPGAWAASGQTGRQEGEQPPCRELGGGKRVCPGQPCPLPPSNPGGTTESSAWWAGRRTPDRCSAQGRPQARVPSRGHGQLLVLLPASSGGSSLFAAGSAGNGTVPVLGREKHPADPREAPAPSGAPPCGSLLPVVSASHV